MKEKVLKEIVQALRRFDRFLVTTHLRPDGDAIGSEIVFLELLEALGKKVVALNNDPVPSLYKFLPGSEKIVARLNYRFNPEVAIVLDSPTLERTGRIKEWVKKAGLIINIDHHISNTHFGNINWINLKAGATGEEVGQILSELGLRLRTSWAVCLYTAILTDTGAFRYTNTTSRTHRLAAGLIEAGANPSEVAEKVYESHSLERLHLISRVLKNIKLSSDGRVAWVVVPGSPVENDEELITYPRSIAGVKVAILFRKLSPNRLKVSFRSKEGVDVNALARCFGGGGHKAASGCVIKGNPSSLLRKVLSEARAYINYDKMDKIV